jgi:allantoin racemase
MRIMVINPNTTARMTEKIAHAARAAAGSGTEIVAVNPAGGPASIEGHYDEAISVLGLLEEIRRGEREGVDGYVVACFGDPGLFAAREVAKGPVLGIAEAAMHAASFVATGFTIVTTLERTRVLAERLVALYGMSAFCRNVRATDLPVLDLEGRSPTARRVVEGECRRAIEQDHSGAIVLGCAGMTDMAAGISRKLRVPVIDGVGAAVAFVEALVRLGLGTSKLGDFAPPVAKRYTGAMRRFSPARGPADDRFGG